MRIIGGSFKGRPLATPPGLEVRPATGRVRQVMFDVLSTRIDLDGAAVLDLFAGSGSLGFEALSRGAMTVEFVESAPAALSCINANAAQMGCTDRVRIHRRDARAFVSQAGPAYDLIFADPPYRYASTAEFPGLVFGRSLVRQGGYLLIEHAAGQVFAGSALYAVETTRTFGRTVVSFFTHPSTNDTHTV
jgi:16S rRNA (guanine966-N2)-methyltransferase